MGKKKKPFIDKKAAHSFQLVHRSQRDPLQADEDSSKHVLLPIDSAAQESQGADKKESSKAGRAEAQQELGVFFEDEYDYLQHLKTRTDCTLEPLPSNVSVIENKKAAAVARTKEFGSVKLPSEAFASAYEEEEGLLNLAAPAPGPHPEWDPDIVAALDDDLDLDNDANILDDDFIVKANAACDKNNDSGDDDLIRSDDDDDDDDDDNAEKYFPSDGEADDDDDSHSGGFFFDEEETKSRFTNYSMTSSVIRRNKGLTTLDDQFDKVMEEYDDDEIGSLDHEEVVGIVDVGKRSHILDAITEEMGEPKHKVHFADEPMEKQRIPKTITQSDDSDDDKDDMMRIAEKPKEQWDCESILSTYSNLYNHPTLIKEPPKVKTIKLSKKTGIPIGVLPTRVPSNKDDKNDDDEEKMEIVRTLTTGPKPRNEGKEEKRLRKQNVKDERRQRRTEKKSNKLAFKAEEKRQEASVMNSKQQKGVKL